MAQRFAVAATTGACAWLVVLASAGAQTCPTPAAVSSACTGSDCAVVTAPMVSGTKGNTVDIPLTFKAGADDGQSGKGPDEVAAIAFTLGAPGSGDTVPLSFDCTDGNLAAGAVTVGSTIANDFTVVVENAQCTNRNRCLCPDTGAGQTRDNFVNIVVYGPPTLPEQGPVTIPKLPATATLATLKMRIAGDAPAEIPLHVVSALDSARPQFAANLSIGDQAACDVSANAQSRSNVMFVDGKVSTSGGNACVGDCDGGGDVAINELVTGVNIALGSLPISNCTAFDCQNNGMVPINCLIQGVNNALAGCP